MTKVTQKMIAELEELLCGTCHYFDLDEHAETLGVDDLELALALDDAEIFRCDVCGWWSYPGETCGMHDHDGIVCTECCEEKEDF